MNKNLIKILITFSFFFVIINVSKEVKSFNLEKADSNSLPSTKKNLYLGNNKVREDKSEIVNIKKINFLTIQIELPPEAEKMQSNNLAYLTGKNLEKSNQKYLLEKNDEIEKTKNIEFEHKGEEEAKIDINKGILEIKVFGLPIPGYEEYVKILKEKLNVTYSIEGTCEISQEQLNYINGYNKIMENYIKTKYGKDILDKLWDESRDIYEKKIKK